MPAIKFTLLIVLWLTVFYPVLPQLIDAWLNHSDESHGILVPLICLYLAWQKKDRLAEENAQTSLTGLWILMASMAIYLASFAGSVAVVSRLMIVTSLIGIVLFVYGRRIFKILAFPMMFAFFMVPVPESIVGMISLPLQLFATDISAFLIHAVNVPVYQEGNMLYFAQTQLEVAEACSGIRSITALTMLSVLFVYLLEFTLWKKVVILLSAVPIALIANIVRVTGTGILAHFFGAQVARGFLHDFSGMVVFIFGLAVLFIEVNILKKL
ncbi:MAG: exosortase/archaeosortase family protein [Proteobacteria bacterium]|nr:exosortase/archaeosortase family protein [Pseudomonadota bacterium]MBU1388712.1 exosortase/archaeosortase family protein [Pseudomonadota bacterium]MBU1543053.1 exosortase/archaeosortase family protein [Pseudomonadota bacterium]MBU2431764.1 exosortase/archaeosortase family protein [Pseudomonadota bacterium]MBU2482825.1 exosortase/archaeosortase family protein [Pseudomonadota bacterium]